MNFPKERGNYKIEVFKDGVRKTVVAWYNPATKHWFIDGKECGSWMEILLPGDTKESTIIGWSYI